MGYDGRVYRKGEYVDINSPDEVKRLLGYGVIFVNPLPVAVKPDVELKEEKKVVGTSITKTKKGSGKK